MTDVGGSRSERSYPTLKRCLSLRNMTILSEAYEISPAAVASDAATVEEWQAPWDDLLVCLEQRHGWGPEMATHYLRTVLVGLNSAEKSS